jgi:hypothetical protein
MGLQSKEILPGSQKRLDYSCPAFVINLWVQFSGGPVLIINPVGIVIPLT